MKTPAVPAANSNNSTIKHFNEDHHLDLNEEDFPHQSTMDNNVDFHIENNEFNPYGETINSNPQRLDEYPHFDLPHEEEEEVRLDQQPQMSNQLEEPKQPLPQPEPNMHLQPEPLLNEVPIEQPPLHLDMSQMIELLCRSNNSTPLSNQPSIEIKLSFPEKKVEKTGLLSKKKFVSFLVTTLPCKYQVRRKYNDFLWLKESLIAIYPGVFIPPIPSKKLNESTCLVEKIDKRMNYLSYFINSIAQDPLLKGSTLFFEFISISNKDDFAKSKLAYPKSNHRAPIEDLSTLYSRSGKLLLDKVNAESSSQFDDLKSNCKATQAELTKLNKVFKQLFIEMKQVSDRLIELSSIFNSLSLISSHKGDGSLSKSYDDLKRTMLDLSYNQRREIQCYDVELKQYFKYLNREYLSIRELYDDYFKAKESFDKGNEKLKAKKEDYFHKGDPMKWDLNHEDIDGFDYKNKDIALSKMFPKETQHVQTLQMVYYYFANNCIDEFNRVTAVFGNETDQALTHFISASKAISI